MNHQFRIFLSSTWEDLQPEREAVEKALHRMRDTAFSGMEYFGSRPDTPREVSLSEVDRSDVYIGIFAHRYGSGITEAEYRQARHRDIPCLIYLKDDTVAVPPTHIDRDVEKIAKLEDLKHEIKLHHTISFFKNSDELATKAATDLHNLIASSSSESSASGNVIASGDRSVAIGGNVSESTILTGDQKKPAKEHPATETSKYEIHIENAQGLVIGDKAQVTQNFGGTIVNDRTKKRVQIQLILDGELSGFTAERREILQDVLVSILQVNSADIRILKVEPGSVRITIEMPTESLDKLKLISANEMTILVNIGVRTIHDGQHEFHLSPSSDLSRLPTRQELTFSFDGRLRDLTDHIRQDLILLKEYEDALRYEDDPRRRAKYRRETEQLRESAVRYQQEYGELREQVVGAPSPAMQEIATQLGQMDARLNALLSTQVAMRDELKELRQTMLARFDVSDQVIISTVLERLDQNQLATVQTVLDALEGGHVAESELQDILIALQQSLAEIREREITGIEPALSSAVERAAEVVAAPTLDVKHKLKITAPIIPMILSYEGEVEFSSGLNLKEAWNQLIARIRGRK